MINLVNEALEVSRIKWILLLWRLVIWPLLSDFQIWRGTFTRPEYHKSRPAVAFPYPFLVIQILNFATQKRKEKEIISCSVSLDKGGPLKYS